MDKIWSTEAIKETAANNWSLEGDNQLLNLMKSISKNLEQRCMTSNNNLNRLMLDVDKTKIKLGNATTKLLDLNNAKFVEHTVMDMDSILSNTSQCSTVENDKIVVPIPKAVEEAVTNGLKMMDRCYEKVLLNLEDSDEDDDNENGQKQVVCRPKDPYQNRPLPHLIGSKQWNEKWHIGLIESDEEVLSDEESEEFSQSSSQEEDSISHSPRTSNPPTTSESDFVAPTSTFIPQEDLFHRLSDDVEEKSPLFTQEDDKHRGKIQVLPTTVPVHQYDAKDESKNESKHLEEPPVPSAEQSKQTIFKQKKPESKFLNLFDDEPPMLDEPIRKERKPVNLFVDSDDDEEDLVTNTKKPSSIFNNNIPNRSTLPFSIPRDDNTLHKEDKSRNAFYGDVDNNNIPAVPKTEIKPTLKSNSFGGLFDDEPPDDFFDIIVREQSGTVENKKLEKPKLQSRTVNLFESDDDDDDFSKIIGTAKKSDTKPAVSLHDKDSIPAVSEIKKSEVSHSPYSSPFKSIQNTGPPSSYVSFLDGESPRFEDDKVEIRQEKEPIASHPTSTRKDLFDDTPPDDVIVPVTTKRKSPAKIIYDDIAATLQEHSTNSTNISSKSLFNETPPDDDVIVKAPPVTLPRKYPPKPVHHDNIADPIKSTAADVTANPTKEQTSDNGPTRDETDQSLSFKKNLSLFSNPEVAKPPTVDKETKPKPNKLKTNFNINVAALLPGAKLPSQKQSATVKEDRIDEREAEPQKDENVTKDDTISSGNVTQVSSSSLEDTSGRLTCLSKNRARIQVQRKPSTRTGRQSLYKKTLIAENENVISSVETTDCVSSEEKTQEQVPSEDVLETDVEKNDWLSEATTHDQPPRLESNSSSSNVVDDYEEEEEDWLKNVEEKASPPSKTNLYDDDWLSANVKNSEQKPSTQNLSHVMNYDWLTASSLPPEDINPPPNYPIDDDHEQDDWLTSYISKDKSSVVADIPNDDDDWLITSENQEESLRAVSTVAATKREEPDWLLKTTLQSEKNNNPKAEDDNDDWLTKSLAPPKVSTMKTDKMSEVNERPMNRETSVQSNSNPSKTLKSKLFDSDDENQVADVLHDTQSKIDFSGESSKIFESKRGTKNFLNSTLFDDDNDDMKPSTDFVQTAVPDATKQSQQMMNIAGQSSDISKSKSESKKSFNSKLFDDDDDDDDLFTTISQQKLLAKQTTTEAVKTTKSVSIKASGKSLFSDDDNSDPDDLFGTTTIKKQKGNIDNKPKVNKPIKAGLFDDEDDDEDIFASKTQKQRVVQTVQTDTKKKSTTKLVATIPASNDPLADLLK